MTKYTKTYKTDYGDICAIIDGERMGWREQVGLDGQRTLYFEGLCLSTPRGDIKGLLSGWAISEGVYDDLTGTLDEIITVQIKDLRRIKQEEDRHQANIDELTSLGFEVNGQ